MILSEKQQKDFYNRYTDRYYPEPGKLPVLPKEKEEEEYKVRQEKINEILGKQGKKVYKYRARGKQTVYSKVLDSLWLNYGPEFKDI